MPVTVEQISAGRPWGEPFDVDEFVNIIHSGRDEGGKESPDC